MSNIDHIIEKIRKLRALAHKNPNENEASAAARLADKLFQEYRLEESQLHDASTEILEDSVPIYTSARKTAWKHSLVCILAEHYGCTIIIHMSHPENGRNMVSSYHLIGLQTDINICKYLFAYLSLVINGLAERDMRGKGRVNVASYCQGVVAGIREQLSENKREIEAAHAGSTALVSLNNRANEARNWMHSKHNDLKQTSSPSGGRINGSAFNSGREQGLKLNVGATANKLSK